MLFFILLNIQFTFNTGFYLADANIAIADSLGNQLNYSGLIQFNKSTVSYYRPFQISEFDLVSIETQLTAINTGFSLNHFGFNLYNESLLSFWHPLIFDKINIGFKYSIKHQAIKEYGSRINQSISLQTKYQFVDNINILYSANNIIANQLEFEPNHQLGISFLNNDQLIQFNLSYKNNSYQPSIHIHKSIESIILTSAYLFKFKQIHFGLKFNYSAYQFLLAFSYHNQLGISQSLGIAFFY